MQEKVRDLMEVGAWTRGYVERGEIVYSGVPKRYAYEIAEILLEMLYFAQDAWNLEQPRVRAAEADDA